MDELYFNSLAESLKPIQNIVDTFEMQTTMFQSAIAMQEVFEDTVTIQAAQTAAASVAATVSSLEPVMDTIEVLSDIYQPIEALSDTVEVAEAATETIRKTFDFSAITAAISSALSRIVDLFAGVGGLIQERFTYLHECAHNFFHWFFAQVTGYFRKRKERRQHNNLLELKKVLVLCVFPCVKALAIKFHESTILIRFVFLLRNQDRGSSDDSDNYFIYAVAR